MRTLQIQLPHGAAYPITIGAGLLSDSALVPESQTAPLICIVTNNTVAEHYLETAKALFCETAEVRTIVLPDGEQHKNLHTCETVFNELTAMGATRDVVLAALGGGVIGDLTGFVAATYMRGVSFIQLPTSLLAQVDASVGGKTGVNHPRGKNLIGAFHQPTRVLIDTTTLTTLPEREYRSGLAEVVKYGLLEEEGLLGWLEDHATDILDHDEAALEQLIFRSCEIKARIVVADEREQGIRAILNLGHTFGHAIETATGYQRYLHGEAVAIGLVLAAELSLRLELCDSDLLRRTKTLLNQFQLPTRIPADLPADVNAETLASLMRLDKKVLRNRVRFVLLNGLGNATITDDVTPAAVELLLAEHLARTSD